MVLFIGSAEPWTRPFEQDAWVLKGLVFFSQWGFIHLWVPVHKCGALWALRLHMVRVFTSTVQQFYYLLLD